jgi:hypothetical protein
MGYYQSFEYTTDANASDVDMRNASVEETAQVSADEEMTA